MDQDEEWAIAFGKREQSHIWILLNSTQKEKKKISEFQGFLKIYIKAVIEAVPCYYEIPVIWSQISTFSLILNLHHDTKILDVHLTAFNITFHIVMWIDPSQ